MRFQASRIALVRAKWRLGHVRHGTKHGVRHQQERDSSALFGKIQLFLEDKSWQMIPEIESAKDRWISTQVNALGGNCHSNQKPLKNLHV